MSSVCPNCGSRSVTLFHKIAAALDTLIPVQCASCAAYAIVDPGSGVWLKFPELLVVPFAVVAWFTAQQLEAAIMVTAVLYAGCFALAAQRLPLLPFVPQDADELPRKRLSVVGMFVALVVGVAAVCELLPWSKLFV